MSRRNSESDETDRSSSSDYSQESGETPKEALHLNEHEAARWLSKDELESVEWLPADWEVIRSNFAP